MSPSSPTPQKSIADTEPPAYERPSIPARIVDGWKWIIGYDQTPANRLGVQSVTTWDYVRDSSSGGGNLILEYLRSLFPFFRWITRYNRKWLLGDLIAGITVGLVVVPQSMSYAGIATLDAQYGLYSSFIGVFVYALFATSKDVTIGPVAVMSLQTAQVIKTVHSTAGGEKYTNAEIATALAFICGFIVLGIGLLRIGWIVEFIPAPAVSGFMTGSAFTIAAGQVPGLLGTNNLFDTRSATHLVIINTLKHLPQTNWNAAFGLPALAFLYIARSGLNWAGRRYPKTARLTFFAVVLRNAFVIIVFTIASRLWCGQYSSKHYPIQILKTVPRGFQHVGPPVIDSKLLSMMGSQLPVSCIVLLLEHIAISKSFGRLNNYKINPNQELVAIGVTNTVGSAFNAYAATGSFSRSAIKSKSGVRTPAAGWITGIVVLIALYALTGTFYWIPNATLAAVIIHAVGDLIASPRQIYKFWQVSPFEFFIFWASVFVSIFKSLDWGIYVSVIASAILLLVRIARPRGAFLGRVRVYHSDDERKVRSVFVPLTPSGMTHPHINVEAPPPGVIVYRFEEAFTYPNAAYLTDVILDKAKRVTRPGKSAKYANNGDRPWNDPGPNPPWVRKVGGWFTFGRKREAVKEAIAEESEEEDPRPLLKALVLDFSGVSNVDTTSVQALIDTRKALELYADAEVEFHFASILSPWIKRALLAGAFGTGTPHHARPIEVAAVVPQRDAVSEETRLQREREALIRRQNSRAAARAAADEATFVPPSDMEDVERLETRWRDRAGDVEAGARLDMDRRPGIVMEEEDEPAVYSVSMDDDKSRGEAGADGSPEGAGALSVASKTVPVLAESNLTPFLHFDLESAVEAAAGCRWL